MKKFLIVLLFVCAAQFGNAQGLIVPFTFGPMAGMNNNIVFSNSFNRTSPGGGYALGLFFRIKAGKFFIQPEAYYSKFISTATKDSTYRAELDLRSINANLLVGTRIINLGKLSHIRAFTGPGMNFYNQKSLEINTVEDRVINQQFVWNIGLGLDVLKLSVDLKYEQGVQDIISSSKFQMNTAQVLLSIGFRVL